MINADLLDFSNSNLLDSNIVGKSTANERRHRKGGRGGKRRKAFSNAEGEGKGVDPETVMAGVQAATSLATILANRQPNAAKQAQKAAKKDMKSVCGRRPLLKKKRAGWDKCVAEYNKTKQPTVPPIESSESYKSPQQNNYSPSEDYEPKRKSKKTEDNKILGMEKSVAIPVIVGVLALAGFIVYKKFFAKGAATIATPTATAVA